MRGNFLKMFGGVVLSSGLLLTASGWSQMRGGSSMGAQPGGMNQQPGGMNQQPGTHPNGVQPNGPMGMPGGQNGAEAMFVANAKRNSRVETDLSKMALKNSSNDEVKKLAQQVIEENRKNEMALTGATVNQNPSGIPFAEPIPEQTRKAEKQMKKLSGPQFDGMYLAQLDGYVKNDQKIAAEASSATMSGDLGSLTMQMRNTAEARSTQIAQIAQSANLKLQ